MPLPTYIERPTTPYTTRFPSGSNDNRYENLQKDGLKPLGIELDSDILWLKDTLIDVSIAVNNLVVGLLPGIDELENKNHIPTTDGEGNLSWILIQGFHIENKTITTNKIIDLNITTELLADQVVTDEKIRDQAVTTEKIDDQAVTAVKIHDQAVTTEKIHDKGVTVSKINPEASAIGTVLTAQENGGAAFSKVKASSINPEDSAIGTVATVTQNGVVGFQAIPTKGKILQTKQFIHNEFDSVNSPYPSFGSFNKKFQLSITPVSANSYIVLNISMNLTSLTNVAYLCTYIMALFRNNSLFNKFTGASSSTIPGGVGGLFGGTTTVMGDLKQHSISLIDDTYTNTNSITYEVKGTSQTAMGYITLNGSYHVNGDLFGVIAVSTITAMEISN